MRIPIGRMNDIIEFGTLTREPDGQGGFLNESFRSAGRIYARVERSTGIRSLDDAEKNVCEISFIGRYLPNISPSMVLRLNRDPDIWKIDEVADKRGRGESLSGKAWKVIK